MSPRHASVATGRPAAPGGAVAHAVLVALVLLLPACAALAPQLEAPQLEVRGVRFIGGDLTRQQIGLKVHVSNPNPRELAIQRIDYGLALAGSEFARGTTAAPFTLPASGATDFDLRLTADLRTALQVLGAHLGERELPYRVSGTVHFAGGLLRVLPFTSGGMLPLR
ncbi:MAG: LEA type 2 family protein [Gammaproteobacteria bacterium]|nr:LEA type 2 family protein [Gammaproteobacteria bacterium]